MLSRRKNVENPWGLNALGLFSLSLFLLLTRRETRAQPTCGVNSYQLAYLLKDFLHATSGMNMDQGGSTTMYVGGQGVVTNPGADVRAVGNGLFLVRD
jgi:exopolysaccharide biosynthesis protein